MNTIWRRFINHLSGATQQTNLHQTILTLCQLGRLKEAVQALLCSSDPLSLDSSAYSSTLQLCIDRSASREGRLIHGHLRSIGYKLDLCLDNKLVIFYAKTGHVDSAREVFDKMSRRSVVSWTAMISGYSQNGYPEEAIETFILMQQSGFKANQFTFASVLRACTMMGCIREASQVHGSAIKSGSAENLFVQGALVDLHAKCGSIKDAWSLFEAIEQRDLVLWNAMIGGYAVQMLGHESFSLFHCMLRAGILPDHFTFASVLRACGTVKDLANVSQIHVLVIQLGFKNDNVVIGSLIDAYVKCRSMNSAKCLYDSMPHIDLISCTALITGYSQETSCGEDAFKLLGKINRMGTSVDDVMICAALSLSASMASVSLGRQIHACAIKNLPNLDLATSNALIDMYSKSGEIEDARHAFEEMQHKNVISWTSLINGYGKHGLGEEACILFEKMESQGLEPNDVTFLSLLFACSHAGLTDKGWNCFNSMVNKYGLHPRAEHYSCVVDLLARGGQLEEAYDFMRKTGTNANVSLWGTLLGACRMHGNILLGKLAASYLFDMDPNSSVNYVVLANIYAASGLWEDAWKTRNLMEERCMRKDPGWSSLQSTRRIKHLLLDR